MEFNRLVVLKQDKRREDKTRQETPQMLADL